MTKIPHTIAVWGLFYEIEDDCDADIWIFAEPGEKIRKFSCTNDCIGQLITQGDTLEEAKQKAEEALSKIHLNIR